MGHRHLFVGSRCHGWHGARSGVHLGRGMLMSIVNSGNAGSAAFERASVGELPPGAKLRVLEEPRIAPDIGTVLVRRLAEQGVTELDVSFDFHFRILWLHFRHTSSPSFTPELLRDIGTVQRAVRRIYAEQV